jgi:hypothetical protein
VRSPEEELLLFHTTADDLPDHAHVLMDTARWLLSDEPARNHTREVIAVYCLAESALKQQGRPIKIRAIAASGNLPHWEHIKACAVGELAKVVSRERIKTTTSTVMVLPDLCKHCDQPPDQHPDGKCLFFSTTFLSRYPMTTE